MVVWLIEDIFYLKIVGFKNSSINIFKVSIISEFGDDSLENSSPFSEVLLFGDTGDPLGG